MLSLCALSGSQLRLRTPMPYLSKNCQIRRCAFPTALTESRVVECELSGIWSQNAWVQVLAQLVMMPGDSERHLTPESLGCLACDIQHKTHRIIRRIKRNNEYQSPNKPWSNACSQLSLIKHWLISPDRGKLLCVYPESPKCNLIVFIWSSYTSIIIPSRYLCLHNEDSRIRWVMQKLSLASLLVGIGVQISILQVLSLEY